MWSQGCDSSRLQYASMTDRGLQWPRFRWRTWPLVSVPSTCPLGVYLPQLATKRRTAAALPRREKRATVFAPHSPLETAVDVALWCIKAY